MEDLGISKSKDQESNRWDIQNNIVSLNDDVGSFEPCKTLGLVKWSHDCDTDGRIREKGLVIIPMWSWSNETATRISFNLKIVDEGDRVIHSKQGIDV